MFIILFGLFVLVADQLTKQWIRASFCYGDSHPVIEGFFNLVYVRNPGAAWGVFGGKSVLLALISLVVLVLLIVYRRSLLAAGKLHAVIMGLMIGGIVGNMIDRIRFGWVTDFLDFEFGAYHFPSFNVADSAICVAVGLYMISNLWLNKPSGVSEKDVSDAA